jgi:hypothetical protein
MNFGSIMDAVWERIAELGAEGTFAPDEPATDDELTAAEAELKCPLPAELREFYQTVGNGLSFFWEADSDEPNKPWGVLSVPSLSSLVELYRGRQKLILYTPERAEEYGFPYTKDPALAKRTAARMWQWLPIIEEPNGDSICIDLGAPGCPVVFDKHSWMDGGTGDNGHQLAPNWRAFLKSWGSVCYQPPIHWADYFLPSGGIDWDAEPFRNPFRVAALTEPPS